MELLDSNERRVILQLNDGTILFCYDDCIQLKNIPGRRRTERKTLEYKDMLILNDALRLIYQGTNGVRVSDTLYWTNCPVCDSKEKFIDIQTFEEHLKREHGFENWELEQFGGDFSHIIDKLLR